MTKDKEEPGEDTVSSSTLSDVEDGRDSHTRQLHHRIICLICSPTSAEPAVGESQNAQNAMLPAQSKFVSGRI